MRTFIFIFFIHVTTWVFPAMAQMQSDAIDRNYLDQNQWYIGSQPANKGLAQAYIGFEGASNAITNSFVKASILNGTITDANKDEVSRRLKKSNRLGTEFTFGLHGMYHTSKFSYLAGLGHRELVNAAFTAPFFETIFRGNKMYAGQEVALGPSNITYLNYDFLYLGISKNIQQHSSFYATFQFIRGGQWLSAQLAKANMYTQADGEYIDLDTQLKINYSNNNNRTFPATTGIGTALNLGYTWFSEKHKIGLEARDLGFIAWQNQTIIEADSNYKYEGIEVNNVLDANVFNTNHINVDTLSNKFNAPKTSRNITQLLPSLFLANYTYHWSSKTKIFMGIKYLSRANYMPKFTLRAQFTLASTWHIVPAISYGGYGNQAIEIGIIKSFANSFVVSTNIFLAEYLIIPKYSSGGGLNFSLSKNF